MKLPKYPYGNETKTMRKARNWLVAHGTNGYNEFDYPEYAGMPAHISSRLSPDYVDFIQDNWPR